MASDHDVDDGFGATAAEIGPYRSRQVQSAVVGQEPTPVIRWRR